MTSDSLVVVGLNHKTAPVGLLERLAIPEEMLPKALHHLTTYEHLLEGAILSTCNRLEVYAVATKFHGGAQDLRNFIAEFCHAAPEEFADHLYTYHDDAALRQLFRVAAGVDSLIVGESEILGQVRRALQAAADEGAAKRVISAAFTRALRVGKRVRTETAIGRNPASISSAAVELAKTAFPTRSLRGKTVAIVGAGKMGRLAARALGDAGANDVSVLNRNPERARELADLVGGRARGLEDLEGTVATSDILICSTTAPTMVIDRPLVERALDVRTSNDPLIIVDIAVPRDVDPSVAELPGVTLWDIDDLHAVVRSTVDGRSVEVVKAETVIDDETAGFLEWQRAASIGPAVAALLEKANSIRKSEVDRASGRLKELTADQHDAVDQMSRRIVAKLLHTPVSRSKELADSKQGQQYLDALRVLFDLDDEEPATD
ncbi:MAG: glutamyl-tRNA reductase [Actinomycetota bacterium]|nr:glutamyl-tRNA reductase [Actinomycetota bacterium]